MSELHAYFDAEKQAALLLVALAVAGAAFGACLRLGASPFRSMAWPLFVVAAAQLAIGIGLRVRTDPQVAALTAGMAANPETTLTWERERMSKVNRNWRPIEVVEIGLLFVGLTMAVGFRLRNPAWSAVGMGLLVEAAIMLVFDLFAEHRALAYSSWLEQLASKGGWA